MPASSLPAGTYVRIARSQLQVLLKLLRRSGFRTIGPQVVDEAIVYRDLQSIDQLPTGIVEEQEGGRYRLEQTTQDKWFLHTTGPESIKKYLLPARETLFDSRKTNSNWEFSTANENSEPVAIVGVRACDLKAIAIQDKVFLQSGFVDEAYRRRRKRLFLIAVNCARAAPTCFCHSMNCGPQVTAGFDLALTELDDTFIVSVGSDRGGKLIAMAEWSPCTLDQVEQAQEVSTELLATMNSRTPGEDSVLLEGGSHPRSLETAGLRELLLENMNHPRWQQIADRCLACGNCTMVCPTCFCCAVEEVSDLSGENVSRQRVWDSCFTAEHSYTNTGTVRKSTAARYRQWLTHKLATWHDQFGESGCVGCGRCITWCPVGIDLTEEVVAIRGTPS